MFLCLTHQDVNSENFGINDCHEAIFTILENVPYRNLYSRLIQLIHYIPALVLVLILNPLLDFFLVYQADVSIFYTSNLYWWGKGWPVDGLPFPDTGCPVPDVSIYYMSNINELPDGILFHWFCKCTPPWMFLPLDIPSEYRPEHVTFGLLCVIFKFPSRIFCRRVPGFATDCPCGVWCRGLTTCLLYVGPPLEF